jgi:hypothetical protein
MILDSLFVFQKRESRIGLRSEDRRPIARLLREESLFS